MKTAFLSLKKKKLIKISVFFSLFKNYDLNAHLKLIAFFFSFSYYIYYYDFFFYVVSWICECVERGQGFTGIQLVSAGKFLPAPA